MKVFAHLDPGALEESLLTRVRQAHPGHPGDRTLIIVPTTRLATHLLRRLAEAESAWLGLEVLSFSALARRMLDACGAAPVRVLSGRLLESLLARQLTALGDNEWSRFTQARPGTLRALGGALNSLREAAIDPGVLAGVADDRPRDLALGEVYERYVKALDPLRAEGWSDSAGLIRAAGAHAPEFARRFGAIFMHGAYNLSAVHLELLRALDRSTPVAVLLPVEAGAPVSAHAEQFARDYLLEKGAPLLPVEPVPGRVPLRLSCLYDENSRPGPAPNGRFTFRHARGDVAEVRAAVREALQAVHDGCDPTEIAIVARNLGPFAAALEEAFDDEGLPWNSTLTGPLRRHPAVRDFLLVLEVLANDFPRRQTAELFRSPRIDWSKLVPEASGVAQDGAEAWSRKARILGGLDEWAEAGGLTIRCLRALKARLEPTTRSWNGQADAMESLLRLLFSKEADEDDPAIAATLELLGEMRLLERVVGERGDVPFGEARAWVDRAVEGYELPLHPQDRGGIRVLDAMQLRGHSLKRVLLIGMNSGRFPRPPREDPILSDTMRRRLATATGHPLRLKAGGSQEERLLLAILLGSASEKTDVSWQRADEAGRAKTPSLALREIARLTHGRPAMDLLLKQARHLPSHPEQWLESLTESPGLLSASEERLLAALRSRVDGTADLGRRFPELAPGLEMLDATQSFVRRDASYDGRIGPQLKPPELSVSALEQLGRCPLQFLFSQLLRVRELEEPSSTFEMETRELGNQVHDLLHQVYQSLLDEGLFDGEVAPLIQRARLLLEERRHLVLGKLGSRLRRRLPVLWEHWSASWTETLVEFVTDDLQRLKDNGWRPIALEEKREGLLDFGHGVVARLRGRLDRTLENDEGLCVGDYKTSRKLDWRSDGTRMLKGQTLQVPLYHLLAGGAQVELLRIRPGVNEQDSPGRTSFGGFADGPASEGFNETVRILLDLHRRGCFPLHKGNHCEWCAFTRACRRNHPPTAERESQAEDTELYRMLSKKSLKTPTIKLLRAKR